MRILICGDRNYVDWRHIIKSFIESLPKDSVIIQGGCRGADLLAKSEAKRNNLEVIEFPADWKAYGKAAGHIRNRQMLDEGKPDIVIAFHENIQNSRGTLNMLTQSRVYNIPTYLNPDDFNKIEEFVYE